ncbi:MULTISPECIES: hypothetical protein [Bradyrhizobium]|uniref:Uncharacterized protein n=1 Tax=Bradyrhizobium elkanii TaxID=29448 RepID=A0A8I1Y8K2_BRAEL|nr:MULTISPECIES: hypothetical protein [Bradyrhizobium]MBP1293984.1 hypothetical protein [Bradyrhizobium elkanii]MCP1925432.1 hypothetical protein [Bradyrhizobium elkanii]MCS3477074.1 hypothetical protein [Bradyrhizobium elkanii]MCS3583812.1 hypothetical protein [Bradyrhizobium elkanii]MCS3717382.1 hypothetical protein [Bradyrhizobium elkanii]
MPVRIKEARQNQNPEVGGHIPVKFRAIVHCKKVICVFAVPHYFSPQ